jgi:hypothetical protein
MLLAFSLNPIDDLAHSILDAANYALDGLWSAVTATTSVSFGSWFTQGPWRASLEIGGSVALIMLVVAILAGAIRGEGVGSIGRTLGALVFAGLIMAAALPLTTTTMHLVDAWSAQLISSATSAKTPLSSAILILDPATNGEKIWVGMALFLVAFIAWLELIVREIGIYLVALFLPIVFGALVWQPLRVWAKRLVEVLVGLVLLKLPIAALIAIIVAQSNNANLVSAPVTVIGGLAVAVFAPSVIFRLVSFAGEAATLGLGHHAMSSTARRGAAIGLSAAGGAAGLDLLQAGVTGGVVKGSPNASGTSGTSGGAGMAGAAGMAAVSAVDTAASGGTTAGTTGASDTPAAAASGSTAPPNPSAPSPSGSPSTPSAPPSPSGAFPSGGSVPPPVTPNVSPQGAPPGGAPPSMPEGPSR